MTDNAPSEVGTWNSNEHQKHAVAMISRLLNSSGDLHELARLASLFLRDWSGCDSIGIRLREGADYPYFETRGLPADFVLAENFLCKRDKDGNPVCDDLGDPVLECMCGNILCGRYDPALPYFTTSGSFWTNSTTRLLSESNTRTRPSGTRNRCNGQGYESVALMPLRHQGQVLGLLQFNDRRPDRFTPDLIAFLETLADSLAIGLANRLAAEALRKSEERYRRIADVLTDYIFSVRVENGRAVETVHEAGCEAVTGYSPAAFAADPLLWIQMVHEDDRDAVRAQAALVLSGICVAPLEHRIRRRDGQWRWVVNTLVAHYGPHGELTSYDGLIHDITDRVEQEARRKFKAMLLDHIGDQVTATDLDGRITYVNAAVCELLGQNREELIGSSVLEYGKDSQRVSIQKEIIETTRAQGQWNGEIARHAQAGEESFLSCRTWLVRDESGEPVGMCGVATDITDRKRTEQALLESEARFRKLFEAMIEGVALHELVRDADGRAVDYRILDVNPAFERQAGITAERARGILASELYGQGSAPYLDIYERVAKTGVPHLFETFFSPLNRHFSISIFSPGKDLFATVFEDVTERKQAEIQNARLEEQMREIEKLNAVGRLAAQVAHDFNNFLTVIQGQTDIARMNISAENPAVQSLDLISLASRQAAEVVRSLLTFSRSTPSKKERISLRQLLEEITPLLKHSVSSRINLEVLVDSSQPHWVIADRSKMYQAIMNLVINARDAMPEGGVLRIVLTSPQESVGAAAADEPGRVARPVCLAVSDTGVGMSSEIRARIFEPFFTTKPLGQGTGLGLSIVYGIVKDHDGRIEVESCPGSGTTFTISLPAVPEAVIPAANLLLKGDPGGKGETVLLAIRDPRLRGVISSYLESVGYQPMRADEAGDWVEQVGGIAEDVRVMVLDEKYLRATPEESLRRIRGHVRRLPIIMLGGDDAAACSAGLDPGIRRLPREFSMPQMARVIHDSLAAACQENRA